MKVDLRAGERMQRFKTRKRWTVQKLEKVTVQMMKETFRKVKRQIEDKKKKGKSKIQYVIENMIGGGHSIDTEIE